MNGDKIIATTDKPISLLKQLFVSEGRVSPFSIRRSINGDLMVIAAETTNNFKI